MNSESFNWSVIIPLKPADVGKSRLGTLGPERASFARAVALDTIDSVVSCPRVRQLFVVTADESLTHLLSGFPRTTVVGDVAIGLNSAIEQGLSVAPASSPRAVLLGDLPALQPVELTEALSVADRYANTFIRDADGTGTTCITAAPGVPLTPAFGPSSAAAHRAAGYVEMLLPPTAGLRRDVDTEQHLRALSPRLGHRTAALFHELTIASPARARHGRDLVVPDTCDGVHHIGWISCR